MTVETQDLKDRRVSESVIPTLLKTKATVLKILGKSNIPGNLASPGLSADNSVPEIALYLTFWPWPL